MQYRKVLAVFFVVAALAGVSFSGTAGAAQEEWTNYINMNDLFSIAADGDYVWSGVSQGLIRWRANDAEYDSFTDKVGSGYFLNCTLIDGTTRWFGVEGLGLMKYDGTSWTLFSAENSGLANNWIWNIEKDSSGNLWIGTSEGLCRFNGIDWKTFLKEDGMASSNVWRMAVDKNNQVWCSAWDGLSVYSIATGTWRIFTTENSDIPTTAINYISVDSDNNVWFATGEGLMSYNNATGAWKMYTTADGLPTNSLDRVKFAPNGDMWMTTYSDGAFKYNLSSAVVYNITNGLPRNAVTDITFGDDGTVWFGTREGIYGLNNGTWRVLRDPNGPVSNYLSCVTTAPDNAVWFGSDWGISRFDGETWTHYSEKDGLVSNSVNDLAFDSAGNLWVATSGGVARFDGTSWTSYTSQKDGIPNDYVYAITPEAPDKIWIGTNNGAAMFDGVFWKLYSTADGLASDYVNDVTVAGTKVWFAGYSGVTVYDRGSGTWKIYDTSNGLSDNSISRIAVEPTTGNVWAGTYGFGADMFGGTSWSNIGAVQGMIDLSVTCMAIGTDNFKWFGSWHEGVRSWNGVTMVSYTTENSGIIHNSVQGIAIAPDGTKWFATSGGASRFGLSNTPSAPQPPANVAVSDVQNDNGHALSLTWDLSPDDAGLSGYYIYRSRSNVFTTARDIDEFETLQALIAAEADSPVRIATLPAGTGSYTDNGVPLNGADYYYWIAAYIGGSVSKPVPSQNIATGVTAETPDAFALLAPYPNPFNAATTIAFTLPECGETNLVIYNVAGQAVRTLVSGSIDAGSHIFRWDGRNERGEQVSSGVYLVRLRSGAMNATKRMMFVK